MKIKDSIYAQACIENLVWKIQIAAYELSKMNKSGLFIEEKAKIIWNLGFIEIPKLEEFRLPD